MGAQGRVLPSGLLSARQGAGTTAGPSGEAPGSGRRGSGGSSPGCRDHGAARPGALRLQVGEPGEISLREHEVLSLCSEQDIEGWLEGINSRGDRGLLASYVPGDPRPRAQPGWRRRPGRPGPLRQRATRRLRAPACRAAHLLKPPPDAFQPLLQPQQAPPASTFQPPGAGFSYGGSALQPSPQQLYGGGGYQASQGSDDDWDDEWDDSSTVADEPGALGSSAYPDLDTRRLGASALLAATACPRAPTCRWAPAAALRPAAPPVGAKSSATVSRSLGASPPSSSRARPTCWVRRRAS